MPMNPRVQRDEYRSFVGKKVTIGTHTYHYLSGRIERLLEAENMFEVRVAGQTVLVPLDYSRIVYSAILGYLLFSEVPGPWSFAGMAVIVACSLYLVLTEKRRTAAAALNGGAGQG